MYGVVTLYDRKQANTRNNVYHFMARDELERDIPLFTIS